MVATLAFLTLDVDGTSTDLAVPAGTRLGEVLMIKGIPMDRIPYRTDGRQLYPDQRIGTDIPSGTLVTLFPDYYDADVHVTHVTDARDTTAGKYAGLTGAIGVGLGVVLTILAIWFRATDHVDIERAHAIGLAAATASLGALFALRRTWDRTLLEILAPMSLGMAAGAISAMGNFGEIGYQVVITSSVTAGTLCVLRWAWRGRFHRPTAQVSFDGALVGFAIGLVALVFLLTGQEFRLFAAVIFGVASPLFIALPGFTIKVRDSQLLNELVVTREAKGVRRATPREPDPIRENDVVDLMHASVARNQLWCILLTIGTILPSPYIIAQMDTSTWQGRAAIGAIVCALLVLLLSPREARMHHLRLIPRLTAAVLIFELALAGAQVGNPLTVAGFIGVVAIGAIVLSILITTKRKPLILTRMAETSQTVAGAFVLPLSLVAIGIINLIRSGGLG